MLLLVATLAAEVLTDGTTTALAPVLAAAAAFTVGTQTRLASEPGHEPTIAPAIGCAECAVEQSASPRPFR